MNQAVIVDAVRTPLGKRNGVLKDWHPADLAAETLTALFAPNGLEPDTPHRLQPFVLLVTPLEQPHEANI